VNYTNTENVYILDKQVGDVNGDTIPDTVYLVGEMKGNPFYENIRVIVQDGGTNQRYVIPLYQNYSLATDPWLFLGNFTGSNASEIMVNLPTPGSGALTYYYVISFAGNYAAYILGPEQFVELTQPLQFEVDYLDGYKVLVKSAKLQQSYLLDISSRKEIYEGQIYDKNGKLLHPQKGFVIDLPHLYPVRFDGSQPYKLEAQQDIAGTSHVDGLGYIITYWTFKNGTWVLDPALFYVMLA
jgi:hypothetical protein